MEAIKTTRCRRNISISVAKHNINYRLPLLRVPTYFMCGDLEHVGSDLERQKALLPAGVPTGSAYIKGAGDYAAMEAPQEFARLMMEFWPSRNRNCLIHPEQTAQGNGKNYPR